MSKQGILPPDHLTKDDICDLYVPDSEKDLYSSKAAKFPQVRISKTDLQWIQVLAEGWATPLRGFMREAQYLQVLYFGGFVKGNT